MSIEIKNCMTLKSVEVGDTVYMRPTGNARFWHSKEKLVRGIVTKIGRKYFMVDRGIDGIRNQCVERFTIDGAECVNDDNYGYILYSSEEEFARDTERDQMFSEIRKYFGQSFRKKDPSYDAISKIYQIMKGENLL